MTIFGKAPLCVAKLTKLSSTWSFPPDKPAPARAGSDGDRRTLYLRFARPNARLPLVGQGIIRAGNLLTPVRF